MKNPVIFTPTTVQYNRGPKQLAPYKAGFFYVGANSGFPVFISSGPSLPSPKKGNCPAEVELLSAVLGGPFFCPLTKRQQFHHAHTSLPPSTEPITARFLTFAAIPPAAFSTHTIFVNRLAPGKG